MKYLKLRMFVILLAFPVALSAQTDPPCECAAEDCSCPPGEQGPQGEIGPMGPQGIQGEIGPVGPQGLQGEIGPVGPQGEVGPAGPQGEIGPMGLQGIQGEIGPVGPQGIQGEVGPMGPQGLQGEIGPVGPQGEVGPMGPQGIQGEIGPMGPQGIQGEVGPAGPQGEIGPMGLPGRNGMPGEDGPQGPQGEVGPAGPQGEDGQAGPQGEVGPIGPQGLTGLSCWDLNGNGIGDLDTEDSNGDGVVDVFDCYPVACPSQCTYIQDTSQYCVINKIKISIDCNGIEWRDTTGCYQLEPCHLGVIDVEKEFLTNKAEIGDTVHSIITYCNVGTQDLTNVTITDIIGPEFNLVSVNTSVSSWSPANNNLFFAGPLIPNQCEFIDFELEVLSGDGIVNNIVNASANDGSGNNSTSDSDHDFVIVCEKEIPSNNPIARVTGGIIDIVGTDTDGDGVDDDFSIAGTTNLTPEFLKQDGTPITTPENYTATLTNICTNTLVDSWTGTLGTTDYISDGIGATDATNDLSGQIAHNTPFILDKKTVASDANMIGLSNYGVWEICFTVGGGTAGCPNVSTNSDNCTLIERIISTGGDNQAFPIDLVSNSPPDNPRIYDNYGLPYDTNLDILGSILQIPECAVRNFTSSGVSYVGINYSRPHQVVYINQLSMTDGSVIDGTLTAGADPIWGLAIGNGANPGTVSQLQYYDELFDYTSLVLNNPSAYLIEATAPGINAIESARAGTFALSVSKNLDCAIDPTAIKQTILEYEANTCPNVTPNGNFASSPIILNWNILNSETY